jgi:hypothetical protein
MVPETHRLGKPFVAGSSRPETAWGAASFWRLPNSIDQIRTTRSWSERS